MSIVELELLGTVAAAHPGHGIHDPSSLLHYLAEPVHALGALVVVAAGWLLARRLRHARRP